MSLSPASPSHEFFQRMAVMALLCGLWSARSLYRCRSSVLSPQLPVRSSSPTVPIPGPPHLASATLHTAQVLYIDLAVV
jgi:hypothetical protein